MYALHISPESSSGCWLAYNPVCLLQPHGVFICLVSVAVESLGLFALDHFLGFTALI